MGGSIAPDAVDAVEDMLLCLVDVCLRRMEPLLAGRDTGTGIGRVDAAPFNSAPFALETSAEGLVPSIPRNPLDAEYWVWFKSFEAPAVMLLCKSSKLTDGRKS